MSTRCAICQQFSVNASPHRKLGLYRCKAQPIWIYPNPRIERDCPWFSEVAPTRLQERLIWEANTKV